MPCEAAGTVTERATTDNGEEDKDGVTATTTATVTPDSLCAAVRANSVAEVEECLRIVPVNAKDSTQFTAVRLACLYGWADCLRALLKAKAAIQPRDSGGAVPLHKAARGGHRECVELLLQHQAGPNKQTHGFRDTPLMQAATHGQAGCVELLLQYGAEPHLTDVHGRTARELAKHAGRHEITKLIPKPIPRDKGRNDSYVAGPAYTAARAGQPKSTASIAGSVATCSTCVTPSEKK